MKESASTVAIGRHLPAQLTVNVAKFGDLFVDGVARDADEGDGAGILPQGNRAGCARGNGGHGADLRQAGRGRFTIACQFLSPTCQKQPLRKKKKQQQRKNKRGSKKSYFPRL